MNLTDQDIAFKLVHGTTKKWNNHWQQIWVLWHALYLTDLNSKRKTNHTKINIYRVGCTN